MQFQLNKREVLRYLGYRKAQTLSEEIDELIERSMLEVQEVAQPRYSFLIFPIELDHEARTVKIVGAKLDLSGDAIYRHLRKSKKVVLLAISLGIEVERQMQRYEISEMTRAFIFDACCGEYIEKILDLVGCDIAEEIEKENLIPTRRFSPGYGDLPLSIQAQFLSVLKADRKLGINLSPTSIMMPRKSVTAIIGLSEEKEARSRKKESTNMNQQLLSKVRNYRIEV